MHELDNEKREIRKFGIGLTLVLFIIGGWQLYKGYSEVCKWFFGFGGLVLILSISTPILLKPLYKVIIKITGAIGWVNTRILLGIMFYAIFTPTGIFIRLIRKDLLDRRLNKDAKSYWIKKEEEEFAKKQYERQF